MQLDFMRSFDHDMAKEKSANAMRVAKKARADRMLTCVEICAGAGGQAIGLERAGFTHVALVEYESEYCDVIDAA